MKAEELKKVLELHKKWINDETDGIRANLSYANLSHANLSGADLSYADLSYADLRGANLSEADLIGANLIGANLDYASFPLQCTSTKMIVDEKIFIQFLYHVMKICPDYLQLRKTDAWKIFAEEANKFHHVDECGKME